MHLRLSTIAGTVLLVFLLAMGTPSLAKISGERARKIEAAFLFQFCKYVTWPESSFPDKEQSIILGILGRDPFGSVLDNLARSIQVNGRNVEVRRLDDLQSVTNSHVLYIAPERVHHMQDIKAALAGAPVLLVGDSEGFLQYGIINFVVVDKKIRFNISRSNCKKSGLKISSKLFKVAHTID